MSSTSTSQLDPPGTPGAAHFADAVAAMREPFVVLDRDERLLAWNRAYDALHREADGTPVLRVGMSYAEMQEWRARTGFFRSVSACQPLPESAGSAERPRGDITCQIRDGRWMFVERYALPDGRNIGLWTDITALKETERQLRHTAASLGRSEAQLARAQRIAQIGSDERDLASARTTWSDETYRIFGVAREQFEVTRENVLALVHPDDRAAVARMFDRGREALGPLRQEFRIIRPDGAERIIVRESEMVFDADGTPLRRIGSLQDVTDARARERLERELKRALEAAKCDLEARVAERTRQLEAAQDELLRKERLSAIGQLTAMVAHELRNPLSAIKNTIFALKSGAAPALTRPIERIERSLARCIRSSTSCSTSRARAPSTARSAVSTNGFRTCSTSSTCRRGSRSRANSAPARPARHSILNASAASSSTSSRTRRRRWPRRRTAPTPPSRSAPGSPAPRSRSRSRTMARASRRRTANASSIRSSPRSAPAPGSACRW